METQTTEGRSGGGLILTNTNKQHEWAVVVAQLVERSLPEPEINGSNPVIGNFIYYKLYLKTVLKRRK